MNFALPAICNEGKLATEYLALRLSEVYKHPARVGDGQPVLLIPGLGASDLTLSTLAHWLKRMGYAPKRAGITVNIDCSEAEVERLAKRLSAAVWQTGQRAIVIGHSRGGLFARVLAVRHPELVQRVICLGSPVADPLSHVHPLLHVQLEMLSSLGDLGLKRVVRHTCIDKRFFEQPSPSRLARPLYARAQRLCERADSCCAAFWEDLRAPLSDDVQAHSVYSRADGVVNWRACLIDDMTAHEVRGSHCGLAANREVYELLRTLLDEPVMTENLPVSLDQAA